MSMIKVRRGPARSASTILGLLSVTLLLTCLATSAFGQISTSSFLDDAYYVAYFTANNLALPDASVAITNPGSLAGWSVFDFQSPTGDLCANIYVFDQDQQLTECCSCFVSPNALVQFSVNSDLTANPQNGVKSVAGDIKLTSSYIATGKCTTSVTINGQTLSIAVAATDYEPEGSLRAWITHSRATAPGLVTVTETPFQLGKLSDDGSEFNNLRDRCRSAQVFGSGKGRCNCPPESVNGSKP